MFFAVLISEAQQDYQLNHYMFNQMGINPGYAGSQDKVYASVIYRNQWLNLVGAPEIASANINTPFNLFGKKHGVGLSVFSDTYGFYNDISISLSYAYRISLGDGTLGIGLAGGFKNSTLNPGLYSGEGIEGWIPSGSDFPGGRYPSDPNLPQQESPDFGFDLDAGVFYQAEELYLGLSTTHLLGTTYEYGEETEAGSVEYSAQRHVYITTGYNFQLPNPSFEIKPSIFVKTDLASTQIDLTTLVMYNKRIWGGLTIRDGEAAVLAGLQLSNNINFGLSYDYSISKLAGQHSGSVEALINYSFDLKREKVPQKYKSIRYL
jgi:type IX secretion system PorP/SprF family membrane protein